MKSLLYSVLISALIWNPVASANQTGLSPMERFQAAEKKASTFVFDDMRSGSVYYTIAGQEIKSAAELMKNKEFYYVPAEYVGKNAFMLMKPTIDSKTKTPVLNVSIHETIGGPATYQNSLHLISLNPVATRNHLRVFLKNLNEAMEAQANIASRNLQGGRSIASSHMPQNYEDSVRMEARHERLMFCVAVFVPLVLLGALYIVTMADGGCAPWMMGCGIVAIILVGLGILEATGIAMYVFEG